MAMTETAADFLDTDEHAVEATFDNLNTINVIFDNPYTLVDDDVATTDPVVIAALADVQSVEFAIDKTLRIGTTVYRIRNAEPDETGLFVNLHLEQQGHL